MSLFKKEINEWEHFVNEWEFCRSGDIMSKLKKID